MTFKGKPLSRSDTEQGSANTVFSGITKRARKQLIAGGLKKLLDFGCKPVNARYDEIAGNPVVIITLDRAYRLGDGSTSYELTLLPDVTPGRLSISQTDVLALLYST